MRAKLFEEEIAEELKLGSKSYEKIPITHIIRSYTCVHAYTESKLSGSFCKTISDSVDNFIGGGAKNIVNGITSIISTGLSAFIGNSQATADNYKEYAVCLVGESLIRIDLRGYKRKVTVSQFTR